MRVNHLRVGGLTLLVVLRCLWDPCSIAIARQCDGTVVELGPVNNTGSTPAVLASQTLTLNSAWQSVRFYFKSDEVLPAGSYLRLISR